MGTKELIIEKIKELQELVDGHNYEIFKEDEKFAFMATCFYIEDGEWVNEVAIQGTFRQIETTMTLAMCERPWLKDRAISAIHYANQMQSVQ